VLANYWELEVLAEAAMVRATKALEQVMERLILAEAVVAAVQATQPQQWAEAVS
jgi:hypothetical protein